MGGWTSTWSSPRAGSDVVQAATRLYHRTRGIELGRVTASPRRLEGGNSYGVISELDSVSFRSLCFVSRLKWTALKCRLLDLVVSER